MKTKELMKIIFVLILISFLSCNKKNDYNLVDRNIYIEKEKEIAIVDFPDTVQVNKTYQGNIIYTSTFDTIISELNTNGNIRRYIMLMYYLPSNLNIDNQETIKKIVDTTFAYKLPDIPIRNVINFAEKGTYQVDWLIQDMVIFDTIKDRKDTEPLPMKVEETRVSKKVVVVD